MEIRSMAIGELRAADYNPRLMLKPGMDGYERLKRSILEFGLVQPIVWNEQTGNVIGGTSTFGSVTGRGASGG